MSALLRLEAVERAFGGVRAVDGVTFAVATGAVHGLIGPNGAGKTTAINLISGLLAPTAGAIVSEGRPIQGLPPHRIASFGIRARSRTSASSRSYPPTPSGGEHQLLAFARALLMRPRILVEAAGSAVRTSRTSEHRSSMPMPRAPVARY
jgi:ABC-type branched-subunit amino acid transport system ATPase component